MTGVLRHADALLRGKGRFVPGRRDVPWGPLLGLVIAGGLIYGAVMGSYGSSALQSFYSALKVPVLLGAATVVCLPNFFAVNSLLGLRDDFPAACRGVFAAQATVSVTLAALAPVTTLGYASSFEYHVAILGNGLVFAVATLAGHITLGRHYRPLIRSNPLHRFGRMAWVTLYVFVAVQLAWVLRPFVGDPDRPARFLREEAWDNAYVVVSRIVWGFVTGG